MKNICLLCLFLATSLVILQYNSLFVCLSLFLSLILTSWIIGTSILSDSKLGIQEIFFVWLKIATFFHIQNTVSGHCGHCPDHQFPASQRTSICCTHHRCPVKPYKMLYSTCITEQTVFLSHLNCSGTELAKIILLQGLSFVQEYQRHLLFYCLYFLLPLELWH